MSRKLAELVEPISALAERAAAAILEVYHSDFAVREKDDHSPLTQADLAAHRTILAGLRALTPDWPVLSEEAAATPWAERSRWERYWLVDPLDGTREFVKRNGEFTVNIALIENHAPVLGVVQAPATGELAWAWEGGGAWHRERGGSTTRLEASSRGNPLRVAGSRSHASPREAELLGAYGPTLKLPLGSSLKFLRIAAGAADLYLRLGSTSEWDTAAGQCVLEEAGGRVFDLHGVRLRYNTRDSLINPEFAAVGDPAADWRALTSG